MKITPIYLLLEGISSGELIFIFLIILLFFGSKSIPKMARTFGRAMRQLKDASQQVQDDIRQAAEEDLNKEIHKEHSKKDD
tara:strand:- start:1018 stop:1260 length:243 start_codon:yes stop_codon:yes gene_type:complete